MPRIHYKELLNYAHPGDCFYYEGDKYFIFMAKALEERYTPTLLEKLKQC